MLAIAAITRAEECRTRLLENFWDNFSHHMRAQKKENAPGLRENQLRQLRLNLISLLNRNLEPKVAGLGRDTLAKLDCSELPYLARDVRNC